MNARLTNLCKLSLVLALLLAASAQAQTPLGSEITYQGQLIFDGSPVNDTADFEFSLWDDAAAGNPVSSTLAVSNVIVVDGVFTVDLDFGVMAFNGEARWLEIAVASPTGSAFTTLTPRQSVTATPYAMTAVEALNNWSLGGNAGTDAATDFVGTTDAQPLEFRVNDERQLRIEAGGTYAFLPAGGNLIGGFSGNSISPGAVGSVISGGGSQTLENQMNQNFGFLGGGFDNVVGDPSVPLEDSDALLAAIVGGAGNRAYGSQSFIGGGGGNLTGGFNSVVAGGANNDAINRYSTVGGGFNNLANGEYATIPGGQRNVADGNFSFAAGERARAFHNGTFVWSDVEDSPLPTNFDSTADNQFLIDASGGVGIGTNSPQSELDVAGTVTATAFVGDASGLSGIPGTGATATPLLQWGDGVAPGGSFSAVAIGTFHGVGIRVDGSLVSWGSDEGGAVSQTPVTGTYIAVAAGGAYSVALRDDGTLISWGSDSFGKVSQTPTTGNYVAVDAGINHAVAIRSDGSLVSWGWNEDGQVSQTPSTGTYVAVGAGIRHSVALTDDGQLVSWGNNLQGQVSQTPSTGTYVAVAAGLNHSIAIAADGSLRTWGWNLYNQVSSTPTNGSYVAVAGGKWHSTALAEDGSLVTWGLGPVAETPDSGKFVAVAAGGNRSIAIRGDALRYDASLVGIGRTPTTNKFEVEGDASKSTAGDWLANSDRRIKTSIERVTGALDTLDRVRLVSFEYTDDYQSTHRGVGDGRYLNVIAQEFAEVFPDHVKGSGERLPDGSEILQVDTYPLTIYSAAAVQELHDLMQARKAELDALRAANAELRERVTKLEDFVASMGQK